MLSSPSFIQESKKKSILKCELMMYNSYIFSPYHCSLYKGDYTLHTLSICVTVQNRHFKQPICSVALIYAFCNDLLANLLWKSLKTVSVCNKRLYEKPRFKAYWESRKKALKSKEHEKVQAKRFYSKTYSWKYHLALGIFKRSYPSLQAVSYCCLGPGWQRIHKDHKEWKPWDLSQDIPVGWICLGNSLCLSFSRDLLFLGNAPCMSLAAHTCWLVNPVRKRESGEHRGNNELSVRPWPWLTIHCHYSTIILFQNNQPFSIIKIWHRTSITTSA